MPSLAPVSATPPRRNVLWIFADQLRAQALGYNGDPNARTPVLDRLAIEGCSLRGAVSGFPLCCPFRGSLLTGRYPHHVVNGHQVRMDPKQPTVATPLRDAGYHTAWIGKWHLDGYNENAGRAVHHLVPRDARGGFDTWLGYENNNSQWDCWVHGHDSRGREVPHARVPGYETDGLTDHLLSYLHERGDSPDQPFFAALSVQPPHNPYVAPEEWMRQWTSGAMQMRANVPPVEWVQTQARREYAGYHAMLANLDHNVGRILAALEANGQAHNTDILFFSDHGDLLGSHGQFLKMSPLEESIRIPFIYHTRDLYGQQRRGERNRCLNHVDIAPTTLGLCGIEVPAWMEGADHAGFLNQNHPRRELPTSAYLQSVIPTMHGNSIDRPWRGVVTDDGWKYTCLEGQPWLLHDLNTDPYEYVNLAHNVAHRHHRQRLHGLLEQWMHTTGDSFALPPM